MTASAAGPLEPRTTVTAALVGRPNSGKTSLLMQLTGAHQRPVNFPGTSVERVEGAVTVGDVRLRAVDLPGISSLRGISRDEVVALGYLRGESQQAPDVLCAVLDASKLSIELHLLKLLLPLGAPIVVALNKLDVARTQGHAVRVEDLARELGLSIVEVNAKTGRGIELLKRTILECASRPPVSPPSFEPEELARRVQEDTATGRAWTDRIDAVLLHRFFGPLFLAAVILGVFQLVFTVAEPFMGWIEAGQVVVAGAVEGLVGPGALRSFLVDGLVNGVGSVLVFIPQIALLMALVTLLEATGYMARAAFLLDRLLGRVGLSGKSFVPLTSSFACAIPGILATRIIDDERDRLATIAVAPLMSCSARLPVYVVLIGAFFPVHQAGLVLFSLYLLGIVAAAAVAFVLRGTVLRGGRSMLAMELPVYQRPSWRVMGHQVWMSVREFLILAGTVIFAATILVWLLSYYPRPAGIHERFEAERAAAAALPDGAERVQALHDVENAAYFEQSYLARFGKTVQPVFAPAGFDWRTTVGILAAFPARELVIPTLGTLYSLGEVDPGDYDLASMTAEDRAEDGLRERLASATDEQGRPVFNSLVALALMVFFALCSQCVGTLSAIRRETRSWRWPVFTFTYMTALAWVAAVAVYQVGSLLGYAPGA